MRTYTKRKEEAEQKRPEMEQSREDAEQHQIPLKCPRCGSQDTRFRYFNNNSSTQPRHHCRTCKRQWTVGGKLRTIPVGGNTRNGKAAKASSSRGIDSRCQPSEMVSQDFDTTSFQPITNFDQILCLDATQTLIQEFNAQHLSPGNPFSSAGNNMTVPQEWNVQTMALQQASSHQNSVSFNPYQIHTEATNEPPSHSYINGVLQPSWPMNFFPQDTAYDSSFTMPNACLQNNLSGDTTDTEDTADVNVDEWLNFPGCDPP